MIICEYRSCENKAMTFVRHMHACIKRSEAMWVDTEEVHCGGLSLKEVAKACAMNAHGNCKET